MAILEQSSFTAEGQTITVAINYDATTLRLTSVSWDNPRNGRVAVRAQLWNDLGVQIYARTETSRSGQRTIIGVFQVVPDPLEPGSYKLPDGWEVVVDAP